MPEKYDVIVIGGGTAGLVTASGCARLGRKVALIERDALGGDCLWTGCVPTKSLVATAKLVHQMRHAAAFGLEPHRPRIDAKAIMSSMRDRIAQIQPNDDPSKFRALGIDVIEGSARFAARDAVEVNGRRLEAKDIVIATGSRTAMPPIESLHQSGFLDHRTFLAQDTFPASLLILGGGYIGIEFAQMFVRFGSTVTVVEMLDDIVNKEDPAIISRVRNMLIDEGVGIRTGWAVKAVRRESGKKIVRIENRSGQTEELSVDEIFVASGRRGNVEGLGLEDIGVKMNGSFVAADKYLQTSVPRIWACGDIHGGMQFTHVAAYEAVKLVRNMLFPGKSAVTYDHVPWALYTDPEVGHIGMTELEAKRALGESNVRVYEAEMGEVDRAVIDRTARGLIKLVCDAKGRIVGGHAFCANASTVIEEIVLARKKGVKAGELAQLVSPYPSLADGVQKAASQYYRNVASSWIGAVGKRVAAWAQ